MSLADLASIGSFISGIGVVVSLIYLGLQVRQAKMHQQAAIRQGRASRMVEMFFHVADPALAEACAKGNAADETISEIQLQQYQFVCLGLFYHYEDEYFQNKEGLTNDAAFASFVTGATRVMSVPGLRVQWKYLRGDFVPEFAKFLDGLVAKRPMAEDVDILALWKGAIAAEKAQSRPRNNRRSHPRPKGWQGQQDQA
ncbi:MAG: hypothetical protein ABI608_11230 [Rhizomicrobium sp.]